MRDFSMAFLNENLNKEEFKCLCHFIQVEYDALSGNDINGKVASLYNLYKNNREGKLIIIDWISKKQFHLSRIYISYAWRDKAQEFDIENSIDDIYNHLTQKGFNIFRDKVDLPYGESIKDFMKKIGRADFNLF